MNLNFPVLPVSSIPRMLNYGLRPCQPGLDCIRSPSRFGFTSLDVLKTIIEVIPLEFAIILTPSSLLNRHLRHPQAIIGSSAIPPVRFGCELNAFAYRSFRSRDL
jgi:hypothetical protein